MALSSPSDTETSELKSPAQRDGPSSGDTSTDPIPPTTTSNSIPDGGLQAWLQVLGGWVILVATWGIVNSFGVYQTYYQTVMLTSKSASSISWIGSLQACLLFLGGLVAGPLFDAGYFTPALIVGLFLVSFGMFMTSLCTAYWQVLLAQGICVGIGMGLIFLPAAAIQSQYWAKRRAFAVGISATGSPIAGIIFPIIFSRLLPSIGFAWATRVIAFITLGLSAIPIVFMRPRLPPSGKIRSIVDNTAWKDSAFISFSVGCMLIFLVLYTGYFYIQVFDELKRLSSLDFAPYTVTLLNAGSVIGRIFPMYLSDKWGVLNVTILCSFGSAVLNFGWMGITNKAGVIVWTLLYGISSGAVVVGTPVTIMALCAPDMSRVGTRMGMSFTLAAIAVLVGTPIAGAIFGDFSEARWLAGIGFSAGGLVLGTAFMVVAWFPVHRKKGTRKI